MKKKPMKTKRYADEGLVEEDFKKKGLDSSKDDRVGFFERLRMGNIDSPSSEAYRRYGAGRGRTDADIASRMQDRAVNAAAPNQDISRMGRTVPDGQVFSPFLMGRVPMGGSREAPEESPAESSIRNLPGNQTGKMSVVSREDAPSRVAKVTKKARSLPQNKKASGYQIDEEGPAQIGSQNTFNMDKAFKAKKEGSLAPIAMGSLAALLGASALSKRAKQGGTKPIDSRPSSGGRNPRLMGIDPMMEGDLERMAGEGGPNFKKGGKTKARAKPMQKFASGGSVSSASKRGDGIAQKGKTRGRIC
jgi:hypothetical protein